MPKFPTFPIIYDECKTLEVSFLNKHGYLKPHQFMPGVVTWSRDGQKTASISIRTRMDDGTGSLELDYTFNGTALNYQVGLESLPSNLGKGRIWFFVCRSTGKRCRKLYLIEGYFSHRLAIQGCYDSQVHSHKNRKLRSQFDKLFGVERAYDVIYSKHFKKTYAGKPTKRYLRMLEQIMAGKGISEETLLLP